MKKESLLKKHGMIVKKAERDDFWEDLCDYLRSVGPATRVSSHQLADRLHGAPIHAGEVAGYEEVLKNLMSLGDPATTEQEVPDTFAKPEV